MLKFFIEFVPLIAFFVGYKAGGMFAATRYTLIATVTCTLIAFLFKIRLSKATLATNVLVIISASLTLFSGNSLFIKIKPTILYLVLGIVFLLTNYKRQPAVKLVLESVLKLRDEANWRVLNLRFTCFFFAMAVINEFIWRNFPEETWVNFKVFYTLPITLVFTALQIPYLIKNKDSTDSSNI